jgi:hypothetical protein
MIVQRQEASLAGRYLAFQNASQCMMSYAQLAE